MSAAPLIEVADGVIIRDMFTANRAIHDFLADCRARGLSERTIPTYAATLYRLADRLPVDQDVAKITTDDLRRYRAARQRTIAANTMAGEESHLASFFEWLVLSGKIKHDPMLQLKRTRRTRGEDLDVTTISEQGVRELLTAALPGSELNAIAILAYLGPRRHAVASLKRGDYDGRRIRFREKGAKTIWKPVPVELMRILNSSIARGDLLPEPDDYLVPPEASLRRTGLRDDRVIWRLVKKVADRAGVETHVHALRAAFACFYLERYPDDALSLKEIMGHRSLQTTLLYLRRLDKRARMERVRDLSWALTEPEVGGVEGSDGQTAVHTAGRPRTASIGDPGQEVGLTASGSVSAPLNHAGRTPTAFGALPVVGAGGFEPPLADVPDEHREGIQLQPDLLGDLLARLDASAEKV